MVSEHDEAAALAQALEGGKGSTPEIDALVSLARMLESLPEPAIDLSFVARLEERLAHDATELPARQQEPAAGVAVVAQLESRRRTYRRTLAIAIAAAMILALPIAASASARPGSPLYGLRLRVEGLHVWATCRRGAVVCGFAHLDRATARVADLRIAISDADADMVSETSHRIHADLASGTHTILRASPPVSTLMRLADRLEIATRAIGVLLDQVPAQARSELAFVLDSGRGLSDTVQLAIQAFNPKVPVLSRPPIALPPVTPPPAIQPPPSNNTDQSASTVPAHRTGTKNNVGPAGTPNPLSHTSHEESWSSTTTNDRCPLGVVAAPGISTVCGATGGKR